MKDSEEDSKRTYKNGSSKFARLLLPLVTRTQSDRRNGEMDLLQGQRLIAILDVCSRDCIRI